jgi:hypothetical protein
LEEPSGGRVVEAVAHEAQAAEVARGALFGAEGPVFGGWGDAGFGVAELGVGVRSGGGGVVGCGGADVPFGSGSCRVVAAVPVGAPVPPCWVAARLPSMPVMSRVQVPSPLSVSIPAKWALRCFNEPEIKQNTRRRGRVKH